jgi:hypothetical protein
MPSSQVIQIVGALLNMGAFALLHFEIAPSSALRYLIPNWLGSVLLVISAYVDHQWGFLLLESAWVVVTGYAIAARITGRTSRSAVHWRQRSREERDLGSDKEASRKCKQRRSEKPLDGSAAETQWDVGAELRTSDDSCWEGHGAAEAAVVEAAQC